jgi:predicted peptidase
MRELSRPGYLVFLPNDYEVGDKPWPLLLCLHGSGERGGDLRLVKVHGPPSLAEQGFEFPFILVAPQCPAGQQWDSVKLVSLLDEISAEFSSDPERIYLTGLSLGGHGAWQLGSAYPDKFAAIIPICGWGDPSRITALRAVPTWAFHGACDDVVSINGSVSMVAALRQCGGNARLTIYPDTGHVMTWQKAYQEQRLYDWLLGQHRTSRKLNTSAELNTGSLVLDCFCLCRELE